MTKAVRTVQYEHQPTQHEGSNIIHFTFYPDNGGIVVTGDSGEVLDAGIIREPGVITVRELKAWAYRWMIR